MTQLIYNADMRPSYLYIALLGFALAAAAPRTAAAQTCPGAALPTGLHAIVSTVLPTGIELVGSWVNFSGSERYTEVTGSQVWFCMTGDAFIITTVQGTNRGIMRVCVDNTFCVDEDLYNSVFMFTPRMFSGYTYGTHEVRITHQTGTRLSFSSVRVIDTRGLLQVTFVPTLTPSVTPTPSPTATPLGYRVVSTMSVNGQRFDAVYDATATAGEFGILLVLVFMAALMLVGMVIHFAQGRRATGGD